MAVPDQNGDTLCLLGAGGHGQVVAEAALESGRWRGIRWYDDDPSCRTFGGDAVVGPIESFFDAADGGHAALGFGQGPLRQQLARRLAEAGVAMPSIVHPGACVSRYAQIGDATVVLAGAVVNVGAVVSSGVIVNTGASVDHHCTVGRYAHVCPGAHLAGNVRVGELAWIGIGASVVEGVTIGARAVVGAGAVVIDDVPAGVLVVGVPARTRRSRSERR